MLEKSFQFFNLILGYEPNHSSDKHDDRPYFFTFFCHLNFSRHTGQVISCSNQFNKHFEWYV